MRERERNCVCVHLIINNNLIGVDNCFKRDVKREREKESEGGRGREEGRKRE